MDKRNENPELGLYIYKIITESGKTQQEIADEIGVGLRSINYYCSGKRIPSSINLLKLLKATRVKIQEIPF